MARNDVAQLETLEQAQAIKSKEGGTIYKSVSWSLYGIYWWFKTKEVEEYFLCRKQGLRAYKVE